MASCLTEKNSHSVSNSLNSALRQSMKLGPNKQLSCDQVGSNLLNSLLSTDLLSHKSKVTSLDEEIKAKIQASKSSIILKSTHSNSEATSRPRVLCSDNEVALWSQLKLRQPIGLRNAGNSCYVNAVLQCILATATFVGFCKSTHMNAGQCSVAAKNRLCYLCELVRLLKAQQIPKHTIMPMRFLNNVKHIMKTMSYDHQQDAHEYFLGVLGQMEENCLAEHSHLPNKVKATNPIRTIFGGSTRSRVVCQKCMKESCRDEQMFNLSLDITKATTIQQCLENYTGVEHLKGSNAYKCENCQELRHAKRHVTIHRPPKVLTLQLNRFSRFQKIDANIQFGHSLSLRPFMTDKSGPEMRYRLYATVNHKGNSCRSGHYIAYTNIGTQWLSLNDDMIYPVNQFEVLRSHPYLLFYERIDPVCPKPPAPVSAPTGASNGVPLSAKFHSTSPPAFSPKDSVQKTAPSIEPFKSFQPVKSSPTKHWLKPALPSSSTKADQSLSVSINDPPSHQLDKHLTTLPVSKWDDEFSPPKIIKRIHPRDSNGHEDNSTPAKKPCHSDDNTFASPPIILVHPKSHNNQSVTNGYHSSNGYNNHSPKQQKHNYHRYTTNNHRGNRNFSYHQHNNNNNHKQHYNHGDGGFHGGYQSRPNGYHQGGGSSWWNKGQQHNNRGHGFKNKFGGGSAKWRGHR